MINLHHYIKATIVLSVIMDWSQYNVVYCHFQKLGWAHTCRTALPIGCWKNIIVQLDKVVFWAICWWIITATIFILCKYSLLSRREHPEIMWRIDSPGHGGMPDIICQPNNYVLHKKSPVVILNYMSYIIIEISEMIMKTVQVTYWSEIMVIVTLKFS